MSKCACTGLHRGRKASPVETHVHVLPQEDVTVSVLLYLPLFLFLAFLVHARVFFLRGEKVGRDSFSVSFNFNAYSRKKDIVNRHARLLRHCCTTLHQHTAPPELPPELCHIPIHNQPAALLLSETTSRYRVTHPEGRATISAKAKMRSVNFLYRPILAFYPRR